MSYKCNYITVSLAAGEKQSPSFSLPLLSVSHCLCPHPLLDYLVAALQQEEGPDYVQIKKNRLDPVAFQRAHDQ